MGGCLAGNTSIILYNLLFPPCMGGCLGVQLYTRKLIQSSLPVWEDVSTKYIRPQKFVKVPSLYGRMSCLTSCTCRLLSKVPSQYGRMSRLMPLLLMSCVRFPPYTGGCLDPEYRRSFTLRRSLPIWEDISQPARPGLTKKRFPPYMGGCLASV